jgi:hypothetical protein
MGTRKCAGRPFRALLVRAMIKTTNGGPALKIDGCGAGTAV